MEITVATKPGKATVIFCLLFELVICLILDDDGNVGNDTDDDGKWNLKADILDPRTGIARPLTGVSIGGQAPDGWR